MPKAIGKGWGPKLKGPLADYANASKGTLLLGEIQAHMLKEHAKPSTRRQDIIHPSEVAKTGWCPRSTYERIKACREASDAFLKPAESIGVQLLNIFDEGHLIHTKWQTRLQKMGTLWGNWECGECQHIYKGMLFPDVCSFCNSGNLIYREVPLRAEQYLIAGHADGAIPSIAALIEIKSVGAGTVRIEAPKIYEAHTEGQKIDLQGLWKAIEEPFPSHLNQGQLYLRLCDIMGLPFTKIVFIYESKFNQGVKEFVVEYDPNYCDKLITQCYFIVGALNNTMNPPECPTNGCKDCERYGTQKSSSTVGVDNTSGDSGREGVDSAESPIRRSSQTSSGIIRSSRQSPDVLVQGSGGMDRLRQLHRGGV